MASISSGGGASRGKKSLDHDLPLVPFIDLLLCCVMFLLINAVWTQLAQVNAHHDRDSPDADVTPPRTPLTLAIGANGYRLATTAGDPVEIPKVGASYDSVALRTALQACHRLARDRTDLTVAADDGVSYRDVVQTMDVVLGEGFSDMSVVGSDAL